MITDYVPRLKDKYKPLVTIINGENAASGKGITEKIYKQFLNIGAQVVTLGNHTWNKRDIFEFIDNAPHMIRPANIPESNTEKRMTFVKFKGLEVAVIYLQTITFLPPTD